MKLKAAYILFGEFWIGKRARQFQSNSILFTR